MNARGTEGCNPRIVALMSLYALNENTDRLRQRTIEAVIVLARPALPPTLLDLVVAASFSVLSLLPAVLLQVSLEGAWPALVGAGYVLSAAAVIMHFWEIAGNGAALHQMALLVITVGFFILAVVAVAAPALRN